MKVKDYYLMGNEPALLSMQEELSRLSEQWDTDDGAPEVDQNYIDKWQDDKDTDDLSPF